VNGLLPRIDYPETTWDDLAALSRTGNAPDPRVATYAQTCGSAGLRLGQGDLPVWLGSAPSASSFPGLKVECESPPDAVGHDAEQRHGDDEKGDTAQWRQIAATVVRARQSDLPRRVRERQHAKDETAEANQAEEDAGEMVAGPTKRLGDRPAVQQRQEASHPRWLWVNVGHVAELVGR
jgi:hypothetical protein